MVGVGPGRARCGPVSDPKTGRACPVGQGEQPFDGHDVTELVTASEGGAVDVFVAGYGVEHPLNGGPKVLALLRIAYDDGSADELRE